MFVVSPISTCKKIKISRSIYNICIKHLTPEYVNFKQEILLLWLIFLCNILLFLLQSKYKSPNRVHYGPTWYSFRNIWLIFGKNFDDKQLGIILMLFLAGSLPRNLIKIVLLCLHSPSPFCWYSGRWIYFKSAIFTAFSHHSMCEIRQAGLNSTDGLSTIQRQL